MKNTILALFLALFMGAGCNLGIDWDLDNWDWDVEQNYSIEGSVVDVDNKEGIPGVHFLCKWIDIQQGVAHYEYFKETTDNTGAFTIEITYNEQLFKPYLLIDTTQLSDYRSEGYVNGVYTTRIFNDGIEIGRGQTNNYRIELLKK